MNVQAMEIREVWGAVKPHIEEIMQAMPWRDFHLEDLYAQCQNGQAVLFVDSDVPRGTSFFIAKIKKNEVGETILFIWIAYSENPDTVAESQKAIEEIARSAGCVAIETLLFNAEVAEHARQFGFDQQMFLVRKVLRTEGGISGAE